LQEEPILRQLWKGIQIYGSVRLHAINNFNEDNELTEFNLGDGASRIGIRGELPLGKKWWLFGRAEAGFDVLDTFTAKGGNEENPEDGLTKRLLYGGFDSENLTMSWGKNWSAYYKIAGMTDRFSIFGGSAAGVYNARTDGGPTGMGRADDVIQARIHTSGISALNIKPFNLNVQYQYGRPIPWVEDRYYGDSYGASAWLETKKDRGIGLAAHVSKIDNLEDGRIRGAGINGDARAIATAFRSYGDHWYAALVVARLENIMTTDTDQYVDGYGVELYAQWQFKDRWWLIGGGNWFGPDSDDPEAREYKVHYYILGLRYALDSFNRMLYVEYRMDNGLLQDGTPRRNELTVGFRWDFGHR
jgi:predicted porin